MTQGIKIASLLSLSAITLLASGYRIPEQSLNSVALSVASVAASNGADSAYYNPANMAFMKEGTFTEAAMTYINLPSINYTDASVPANNSSSKAEHFLMPSLHYVSPSFGAWRYGLSLTAPGGLSKRWDSPYAKKTAEEFSLKIIELNPTVSYAVNEQLAIAAGARAVYIDGVVKSDTGAVSRNLDGDSVDFGYNVALSYKPTKDWILSATYRSKVDLTVEGDATLRHPVGNYNNIGASVTIPLPASLALATAYTIDKTTVEFVFERTYWSSYEYLDFNYNTALSTTGGVVSPYAVFDKPRYKGWKDVNAYRLGVSHQYSDALKLMFGFAIDKTPVPRSTLGFELPDSDARLYSTGFEYKMSQNLGFGMAYLYADKKKSCIQNAEGINGCFKDAAAHMLTASLKYKF